MPKKNHYGHLFLNLKPYSIPYTPHGGGPTLPKPSPVSSRNAHARALKESLNAIVDRQRQQIEELDLPEPGFHLTARARSNVGLRVESFQGEGGAAEVLSLKGKGANQSVNLFVPSKKLETFERRLDQYPAYVEEPGKKSPFSFWFFESVAALASTTLRDLWTDETEDFPDGGAAKDWEIWVRPDAVSLLRSFSGRFRLRFELGEIDFPSVTMLRVRGAAADLEKLVVATGAVLELRACSSLTLQVIDMSRVEQIALTRELLSKILPPVADAPRVCILDTGVDYSHPLLKPALTPARCQTLNSAWDTNGWDPHGTRVAGIALFTDLRTVISQPNDFQLQIALESVTVLRPSGAPKSPDEAAGVIARAVSMIEANDEARRVYCLAFADYRGLNDGTPTPLSGSVDQLAWGKNGSPRLFCVAAGNLLDSPLTASGYTIRNEQSGIASPGQALNALTVGGCTFASEHPDGGELLGPSGDLSPTSRTSRSWTIRKSNKPDVVFEAGNHGIAPDADEAEDLPELGVLTTTKVAESRYFATLKETSAATAAIAGMAGRLLHVYPEYWPETIRGLIVHSTNWTEAMHDRVNELPEQDRAEALLSMYGWGVPDEDFASRSASDLLTMIVQGELAPFTLKGNELRLNSFAYYELPWPSSVLAELGSTEVELRITLSYFVEPDLRAASTGNYGRYPSHRFEFDLKGPDDDHLDVVRRGNKALANVRRSKPPARTEAGWALGSNLRERGSIHHDRWHGPASTLARQDGICVIPKGGWWLHQRGDNYADLPTPYSLIISIHAPTAKQDIYELAVNRLRILNRTRNAVLTQLTATKVPTGVSTS
jgi:hypothetical protein